MTAASNNLRDVSPVLRDAAMAPAARLVGRAAAVARAADLPRDPVASALSRFESAAATPDAAVQVDEDALRRGLDEARRAGIAEGREQVMREQAHAGFEEGLRQGLAEGRAAGEIEAQQRLAGAQEQAAERLQRLEHLHAAWSEQLHTAFRARLQGAEDDMVALCHGVICRLLGDQLVTPAGTAQCVRAALETWLQAGEKQSRGEGVVVQVHPADLDVMRNDEMLARWLVQQGLRGMSWEASDGVRLGGCIVRSGEGDLDARLETQLESLRAHLLRGRHSAIESSAVAVSASAGGQGIPR